MGILDLATLAFIRATCFRTRMTAVILQQALVMESAPLGFARAKGWRFEPERCS